MPKKSKTKTKKNSKDGGFVAFVSSPAFRFCMGMICIGIALFLLIAMISYPFTFSHDADGSGIYENWAGKLGGYFADLLVNRGVGVAAPAIPFLIAVFGCMLMNINLRSLVKCLLYPLLIMLWLPVVVDLCFGSLYHGWNLGGTYGQVANETLSNAIGPAGEVIVIVIAFVAFGAFAFGWHRLVSRIPTALPDFMSRFRTEKPEGESPDDDRETPDDGDMETPDDTKDGSDEGSSVIDLGGVVIETVDTQDKDDQDQGDGSLDEEDGESGEEDGEDGPIAIVPIPPVGEEEAWRQLLAKNGPYDQRQDLSMYRFPSPELLKDFSDQKGGVSKEEQIANQGKIIETLRHFNIGVKKIVETIGPTVTLFEIIPEDGVRVVKIQNLEKDIMLSLSAKGIRIICPIPGKGTIGIEVPNANPKVVGMRPLIESSAFQNSKAELPVVMGRTITNDVFTFDLASTPHLIVAGATGQGKSVGLNAIITSLLYTKHPSELKFVLVDPKQLEFSIYSDIERHYLAKLPDEDYAVITDSKKVIHTLEAVCQEMENRYRLLAEAKVRNIKEYNAKFKERRLNPNYGHRYLPYLVVVVDEFGDLIATEGKKIETPIQRITQKARAAGIHMILATQRPSVNVITGVIKANCPTRIAFRVISKVDSTTILDCSGADQLIGRGDMLYSKGDTPQRVQCAFVDTPEVEAIVNHIHSQQSYPEAYSLPEPEFNNDSDDNGGPKPFSPRDCDTMFNEVAEYVVSSQLGSTSNIQRKFEIGFNRAGRLMDQLESAGIVGPARGSKPREVLVKSIPELEILMSALQ